jgi:tripartite-type tricarboxylate transporter receptor subunit TctC
MKLSRRRLLHLAAGALALPAISRVASALDYPARPVRWIVGFPPGGPNDITARIMAEFLSERLHQQFAVENRPGAAGNVATEAVARAQPDGYTVMELATVNAINASLYQNLNYDFVRDITLVAGIAQGPAVMEVNPKVPAATLPEFIAYAKANPGKLNYGSQGIGTTSHLTTELFMALTGTKMVHVPYKGTAPALNDLLAGNVDLIFMELSSAVRLHQGGNAHILAVATEQRLAALPDVPTLIEAGVPGFVSDTWNALSAPPKTPAPIVNKLNQAVNDIIAAPETKKQFEELSLLPAGGSPAEMGKFVRAETARWTEVIRRAGIQPE